MAVDTLTWGDAAQQFSLALGDKYTWNRELFFLTWFLGEDTKAHYNPCATTWPEPGATNFNKVGVKNYVSWAQGKLAWHSTIELGYYVNLRAAIRSNVASEMCLALASCPWGTYHHNPNAAINALHQVSQSPKLYAERQIPH